MKKIIILVLSFLIVMLESTLLKNIEIGGICPNLTIVFVMSVALTDGSAWGRMIGLFMGLAQDVLFTPLIGPYAISYYFIGHIFGYIKRILPEGNLLLPTFFILTADLIYGFISYIFFGFLRGNTNLWFYIRTVILPEASYTSFFILPIYYLVHKISQKLSALKIKKMITKGFAGQEEAEGEI